MKNSNHKNHILLRELNSLPVNWKFLPNRAFFKERIERGFDDKNLLSVTIDRGIIPQDDLLESTSKKDSSNEDKSNYKLVKVNDIAYNKMRMWQGAVGYSDYEGIVSPAYVILKPIVDINSKYYHYLFRSNLYNIYSYTYSYGISNDTLSLRWDEFKRMFSIIPPRNEQDAIVKYLDAKIADIDKYISSKQKLIELLNEQKAAIINKVVTKGIDPNVKMKDSGDKYIGAIPKSWEVRKLKFLSEVIFSNVDKHTLEEEQKIYLCNYVDVYKNDFINSSIDFMKASASELEIEKFSIKMDDIIVTKDSETYEDIAKPAIVIETLKDVICGYHLAIIRCKSELIIPRFLFYLFKSVDFNKQFAIRANGITRYGLSQLGIKDAKVLIPSLIEQKEIVSLIEEKSRSIDQRISSLQRQIDLINEYKNSLIAEAVTGKLKLTANIYEIRTPKNPYFARTVMAAEVINNLYKEPTFGRVKLVKLIFLAEKLSKLDLGTNYHRQAAGPYDSQAIRSIEKQLKEHSWFKTIKKEKGKGYKPLEKVNEYHSWFDKYYFNEKHIIYSIINTFRTAKTIQCEIVATLYSAWEDLTKIHSNITDDEIVNEVLNNWHESKKRIPKERWLKALNWMKVKNIVPIKQ